MLRIGKGRQHRMLPGPLADPVRARFERLADPAGQQPFVDERGIESPRAVRSPGKIIKFPPAATKRDSLCAMSGETPATLHKATIR